MKIERLRNVLQEKPDLNDIAATPDAKYLLEIIDDYILIVGDITRALDIQHPASRWALILVEAKERATKILVQP